MRSSKYILGIYSYFHESSACLIKDGQLVAMAEEERFNRIKHTFVFPINAIKYCLKKEGVELSQVDRIAYGFLPWQFLIMQLKTAIRNLPASLKLLRKGASYMPISSKVIKMVTLQQTFQKHFGKNIPPIRYIAHHSAHAYSAFWDSKFKDAAVLVVDGFGEDTATTLFHGRGNRLKKLISLPYIDSLGVYYGAVTQYLGFTPHNDEYKVMGMAAYGKDKYPQVFSDMLKLDNSPFYKLNIKYVDFYTNGVSKWFSQKLPKALNIPPRKKSDPYKQVHFDIACSAQKRLEEAAVKLGNHLQKLTGSKNLCIAGGVAQNVLMTRNLLDNCGFKNIYIPPVAYDAGCALGAALAVFQQEFSGKRSFVLDRANWGPSYSTDECLMALKEYVLIPNIKADQSRATAELIAKGKIVGFFDDSMEIGPRALGNRSILADPRKKDIKDILNSRIKKREFFRPFAPMVTEEEADKYFDLSVKSPFMTMVGRVKKPGLLPGITHEDGTARIQTVSKKSLPHIHSLLNHFKKITGIPVLLNTSFNENEPIVCTPKEAIGCFLRTKMDALVFNNELLIVK